MSITFLGHASENVGLGNTLRQFAKACIDRGHEIAIVDVDSGAGRRGSEPGLQQYFVTEPAAKAGAVCVQVFGGHGIPARAVSVCQSDTLRQAFNVAFVWWELPDVPPYWAGCLRAFDAVLTGSEFIQSAFANAVEGVPVLLATQPLDIPADTRADRERFGIPGGCFVVYVGFDMLSEPMRKNPSAGIDAFKRAFSGGEDVRLVIKCASAGLSGARMERMNDLRRAAAEDPRIILVENHLSYADLLSLYASCDVAVSLHRAEGLALMPLEFMRLGKPVVATGWSGNMSFMTHRDCGLVSHSFVDTDESSGVYAPSVIGIQSRWAQPDVDDAAGWLAAFCRDPAMRRTYGQNALARSREYDARARKLEFLDEIQAIAAHRPRRTAEGFSTTLKTIRMLEVKEFYRVRRLGQTRGQRLKDAAVAAYQRHVGWRFGAAGRA